MLAWLVVNTMEACFLCALLVRRERQRPKTPGWLWLRARNPLVWYSVWECGFLLFMWIRSGRTEDVKMANMWQIPLYLTLARTPTMVARIPAFYTPIEALRHSLLVRYVLPLLVWMYISSTGFVLCYQAVPKLHNRFGDALHAFKTVFQIMVFDSVAALVDDISAIPHCKDPEDANHPGCSAICWTNQSGTAVVEDDEEAARLQPGCLFYCNRGFGIFLVYLNAAVLGFGFANLIIGVRAHPTSHAHPTHTPMRSTVPTPAHAPPSTHCEFTHAVRALAPPSRSLPPHAAHRTPQALPCMAGARLGGAHRRRS